VLRLAGVSAGDIGRDYEASVARPSAGFEDWVAAAVDDATRAYRELFAYAPAAVMERMLAALEEEHGSVRGYLLSAGADAAALDRLRDRLRA
jgi:hypothetical protein